MTDSDRIDVLEEAIDAATRFVAFLAAERIENEGTVEYLVDRVTALERAPVQTQEPSEDSIVQLASRLESAQATIQTLQKAVKDHAIQVSIAETKIADAERDLAWARETATSKERELNESYEKLLFIVEKQKLEIEELQADQPTQAEKPTRDQATDGDIRLAKQIFDLNERLRKIKTHLTRGLKRFDENPNVTLRAIDYSIKIAEKS